MMNEVEFWASADLYCEIRNRDDELGFHRNLGWVLTNFHGVVVAARLLEGCS